jgi:hypothetical protein
MTKPITTVNTDKNENFKKNLGVALTTVGATLLPIIAIRKFQGKALKKDVFEKLATKDKVKAFVKSFDIKYGLKEILTVATSSIFGGLTGGLWFDKKTEPKTKLKEAIFKESNILIPTTLLAGGLELCKKAKFKGIAPKIASIVFAVGAGMPISANIANNINNNIVDKENPHNRKLKPKDYFVHIDDVLGAFVLARVPFVDKFHLDGFLSAIYALNGAEVGIIKEGHGHHHFLSNKHGNLENNNKSQG